MGRKPAKTLEFIQLDCVDKTTLKRLSRKFGKEGRLFWYELLRLLGRTENYILDLSEKWILEDVIEEELDIEKDKGIEILNILAEWGNIDKKTWFEHKHIWCQALIDRHTELFRKRKNIPYNPLYPPKKSEEKDSNNKIKPKKEADITNNNGSTGISVAEKIKTTELNTVSVAESTQKKVKESKGKNNKEIINKENIFTSSSSGVLYNLQTLAIEYPKNKDTLEAVSKTLSISTEKIQTKIPEFITHLKSKSQLSKEPSDFASHFLNWLKLNTTTNKNSSEYFVSVG